MTEVEIEYCVPCGHLNTAQQLQEAILSQFGQQVDRVSLKTGDGGVFKVSADGDLLFDKADEEFDVDEIVRRVKPYTQATA